MVVWLQLPGRDNGSCGQQTTRRSASPAAITVLLTVAKTTASDFVAVPQPSVAIVDRGDDVTMAAKFWVCGLLHPVAEAARQGGREEAR